MVERDSAFDEKGALCCALANPERAPLGRLLSDSPEEDRVRRMWQRIDHAGRNRGRAWLLSYAAVFAVSMGVLLFWLQQPSVGLLTLAAGSVPTVLTGATAAPAVLADGSKIELQNGSRVEVLRNDGQSFVTVLRRGSGTFDIKPGGPRRWVVEAGFASVEVLGTRFTVTRTADSVRVSVARGVVLVRAESLASGAQRVKAGSSLEVRQRDSSVVVPNDTAANDPNGSAAVAPALPAARAGVTADSEPRHGSSEPPRDPIEQLLSAADAARRQGNAKAALDYLDRVVAQSSAQDPRRGLAALMIARLTMEGEPARAAKALEASLSAVPAGLAEDALARRVEAEARAGDKPKAAALAAEYLRRYPSGRRAEDVRHWSSP